jgi:UDP-glucuronate decarboxylase
MKNGREKTILVAGGGGFLGSHLCERLIEEGHRVVCLDNFLTGRRENLRKVERSPAFELVEADIVDPLPAKLARRRFDEVYNLACAASPPLYQADPEHTLLTSVLGTHHLLKLAQACGARFLLTSRARSTAIRTSIHRWRATGET